MNSSPNREKHLFRACDEPMFRRMSGDIIGPREHGKSHLFQHKSKRVSKPKGQHAYRKGAVIL